MLFLNGWIIDSNGIKLSACQDDNLYFLMDKINYILYESIKYKLKYKVHCNFFMPETYKSKCVYGKLNLYFHDTNKHKIINSLPEYKNTLVTINIMNDQHALKMDNHEIFKNNQFYIHTSLLFDKIMQNQDNRQEMIKMYHEYVNDKKKLRWYHSKQYMWKKVLVSIYKNIIEYYEEKNKDHMINL